MKRSESDLPTTPSATYSEYKRREAEFMNAQRETERLKSACAILQQSRDAASAKAHQTDDKVAELSAKLETLSSLIDQKRVHFLEYKRDSLNKQIADEKEWIANGSQRDRTPNRRTPDSDPEQCTMKAEYENAKLDHQTCKTEFNALDREIQPLIVETNQLTLQYQEACELLQAHYAQCAQLEIVFRKSRIASDTEILAKLEGRKRSKGN